MSTEPMTVNEAGRKGGRSTSQKYGHEHYQACGHKGGNAVAAKYGHEHYQEIGKKGGGEAARINAAGRTALGLPPKRKSALTPVGED
ncbi:MAG: hypothetical protein ACYC4L_05140 [Chloroflexota bacterium]